MQKEAKSMQLRVRYMYDNLHAQLFASFNMRIDLEGGSTWGDTWYSSGWCNYCQRRARSVVHAVGWVGMGTLSDHGLPAYRMLRYWSHCGYKLEPLVSTDGPFFALSTCEFV